MDVCLSGMQAEGENANRDLMGGETPVQVRLTALDFSGAVRCVAQADFADLLGSPQLVMLVVHGSCL